MPTARTHSNFMTHFQKYEATQKLRVLAQTPFDLTQEGNLTPERVQTMTTTGAGLTYNNAMQRVDDSVMHALEELATEANVYEKMAAMQSGEVINSYEGLPGEDRAVLHTAMRDFFDDPNCGKSAAAACELAHQEQNKLKTFMETIDREGTFTDLVIVGIGGSDLGPRALYMSLPAYYKQGRTVHFCANVDPDDGTAILGKVELEKTLFVVISKSGGTLETQTNEEMVRNAYQKANLDPTPHIVAVTGKGGPMDNPSRYRQAFYMWDYVGGRYSATSMVGGVMLAFALGYDQWTEILRGSSAMDKVAMKTNFTENLPLLHAMIGVWNRNFLNAHNVAVIPYSQGLQRFPAHLQQCDMESNGKQVDRSGNRVEYATGPVIFGEPGTNAQHSFFQLIHQGTDVTPLELIGFKESQFGEDLEVQGTTSQEKLVANMLAQSLALAQGKTDENPAKTFPGNRPSSLILGKKLTPYALGALLSFYEHKVAFQGFVWNINSFDQEGVQLGKVLANQILDTIKAKRSGGEGTAGFPLGGALLDQVQSL